MKIVFFIEFQKRCSVIVDAIKEPLEAIGRVAAVTTGDLSEKAELITLSTSFNVDPKKDEYAQYLGYLNHDLVWRVKNNYLGYSLTEFEEKRREQQDLSKFDKWRQF